MKGEGEDNQIRTTQPKRSREDQEESRASKAIRTYNSTREKSKRNEDTIQEEPNSKIIRTIGESRGEVTRSIITGRDVFNPEGAMVDAIDSVEWEETKDSIREERVPVIRIAGGNRKRGIQACEIHLCQEDTSFGKQISPII